MTVTYDSLLPIGPNQWRLTCHSDITPAPTLRLFISGELKGQNTSGIFDFGTLANEYPVLEVLDDDDAVPKTAFPSSMLLTWYAPRSTNVAVASYRIEQWDGAEWDFLDSVREDGRGWYSYRTAVLADETTHRFRVTPIGVNGNSGTAQIYQALMVRHPDPPSVRYSYDSDTREITIAAA